MQVLIDSIDQRMLLSQGNEVLTSLTLTLPNGQKVSVSIQPEGAELVLKAWAGAVNGSAPSVVRQAEARAPVQQDELEVFGGNGVEQEEELTLDWTILPDTELPQTIKAELTRRGFPAVLSLSELTTAADQISAELLEQVRAQQPKVQKLQVSRPRMMPKDELGYPIVPQRAERDPGEMGPGDEDEDGVPQA